jgi:hypothetical protein
MRFVINTNYESAGTKVCVDDLIPKLIAAGHSVVRNDWVNYNLYDVALFMAPDSDVEMAKKTNSHIVAGIMDPKLVLQRQKEEARRADFVLVSSLEQRDIFYAYNKHVVIYFMFPHVPAQEKIHADMNGRTIRIGYHGNKLHLHCMKTLSDALDSLSEKYPIEFCPIYNIKQLGLWSLNRPKKCRVVDVQWSAGAFYNDVHSCDIGVIPSIIPVPSFRSKFFTRPFWSFIWNRIGYFRDDYILRFKYSTNPGRLYVFSQLGVPVVADLVPSHVQFIVDGQSGRLVYSRESWYQALEELILDAQKRQDMSDALRNFVDNTYSPDRNFVQLIDFIQKRKDALYI